MSGKNMYQLLCPAHFEILNLVCLDENCESRGLICIDCQYKKHRHPVKALGYLLAEIDKDIQFYQNSVRLLSQLDHSYSQIQESIESIEAQPDRQSVQEMANAYYYSHINKLHLRNAQAKKFRSTPSSIQQSNQFLLEYNFVEKEANPSNFTNFEWEVHSKIEEFQNCDKDFKQYLNNSQPLEKILKLFELDDSKRVKYYFSSDKSHKDIIITDKVKAELKEGYSYRIGLMEPPVKKQHAKAKKKSCTFKILKVTAMVGIGVMYHKKVQTANYLLSAYSQHGCYLITNSGYTYNQSNSSYNSQLKNWSFTTNDVIKVTLDPSEKRVIFQKEGKDPFEFPFEERPDMELDFGVLLCQQNQCIQIV